MNPSVVMVADPFGFLQIAGLLALVAYCFVEPILKKFKRKAR